MYIKISKKWQLTFDIVMIVVGTIVMGFAFSFFLEPNNISTGGFSGIAMIINSILNNCGVTFLSSSIIYFVLNIGLYIYALKALGKKFAIKALVGIACFSSFMEVFKLLPKNFVFEPLISAIYGGLLMGLGVGLVVRFGGSTGGGDMIACILRKKRASLSIGKIVVFIDIVVVVLSLIVFNNGVNLLPYTILALMVSLFITDFVNDGYKQVRAYYIITKKPDDIANKIMTQLVRGCTVTPAKGMYSKEDSSCLICLVSKFQSNELKRIIKDTDALAFVYAVPVSEVMGTWTTKNTEGSKNNQTNKKETFQQEQLKIEKIEVQDLVSATEKENEDKDN